MKLEKIDTIEQYFRIVEQYRSKGGVNNDYLQQEVETLVASGTIAWYSEGGNAYLFVSKPIGCRLYYYINDWNAIPDFSELHDVVIEILYRGPAFYPEKEIEFFIKSGFKINLIRDQYSGVYKDLTGAGQVENVHIVRANALEEIELACTLFNTSFDVLSGDYISEDQYAKLLQDGSIWVAYGTDGQFLGALHQTIVGKVAWLSHVAVLPEARGRHVGQALLDMFVESNMETEKSRYMLWVQNQNRTAVSMYEKKGFKYISKSTISLTK